MRRLLVLLVFVGWSVGATTFTEWYCDTSNGSTNINAGSTTNATPIYISVNGNWDGTSVYTPTDGSTPASTVSAGMWAAIFVDGSTNLVQASAGGCVMLITNVAAGANGAITFNRAAFMGTAPSSSATGRSIRVGGCWNGPYGTIGFPFGFAANTGTNGPQSIPRVNLRNTSQYNVTAAMTHANNGPIRFQGMTATPGDLGKATISGGTSVTSYVPLTMSAANTDWVDLIFANNGTGGTASGPTFSGAENTIIRCVATGMIRHGFNFSGANYIFECEAYGNNTANSSGFGGYSIGGGNSLVRCISRNNTGNNSIGFAGSGGSTFLNCIAYSNGKDGFQISAVAGSLLLGCVSYSNTGDGFNFTTTGAADGTFENCAAFLNGGYGIQSSGSSLRNGTMLNCVFGSGTKTNTSGNIAANLGGINEIGTITYTADQTPWIDPANGDFRLSTGATLVKAAGRGSFTQVSVNSPTNTVSYPDIGAAQSASTNSAAAGGSYTWAQ